MHQQITMMLSLLDVADSALVDVDETGVQVHLFDATYLVTEIDMDTRTITLTKEA